MPLTIGRVLGVLALLQACVCDVRADGNNMTRTLLSKTKCIDGSPALYYLDRNATSTKFVIWLEGGGICQGLSDCEKRAQGALGSSLKSKPLLNNGNGKGMLLSDPEANPDFFNWNHVFVPYVSGDVWAGQAPQALNPFAAESNLKGWKGYFQGHAIVEEVLESLKSNAELGSATEVILTGCSAGGIGTITNCDFVASSLPKARTSCRPEAGWFGLAINDYPSFKAHRTSNDMRHLATSNWTTLVTPWTQQSAAAKACVQDLQSGKRTIAHCEQQQLGHDVCCGLPPLIFQYTKTPSFVSENTCDSYQVFESGQCPKSTNPAKAMEQALYAEYLRGILAGSLNASVANGANAHANGMFAPACLQHCMKWDKGPTIHGRTHQTAFGDWYFKRPAPAEVSGYMYINFDSNPAHVAECKGN